VPSGNEGGKKKKSFHLVSQFPRRQKDPKIDRSVNQEDAEVIDARRTKRQLLWKDQSEEKRRA